MSEYVESVVNVARAWSERDGRLGKLFIWGVLGVAAVYAAMAFPLFPRDAVFGPVALGVAMVGAWAGTFVTIGLRERRNFRREMGAALRDPRFDRQTAIELIKFAAKLEDAFLIAQVVRVVAQAA